MIELAYNMPEHNQQILKGRYRIYGGDWFEFASPIVYTDQVADMEATESLVRGVILDNFETNRVATEAG